MMFKAVAIFMIVFICFCVAAFIYLEVDRYRFNQKYKAITETKKVKNNVELAPVERQELTQPTEQPVYNTDVEQVQISELENEFQSETYVDDEQSDEKDWLENPTDSVEPVEIWADPNTAEVNYRDMSPEEYAEHFRENLKEKHGDIPEVDVFIDLHLTLAKGEPMKLDDHVVFVEMLNFFYPSEANARGIKVMREYRDKFGGDTILFNPDIEKN